MLLLLLIFNDWLNVQRSNEPSAGESLLNRCSE
jgi:hypothetical protein